jgi:hypothetical protein
LRDDFGIKNALNIGMKCEKRLFQITSQTMLGLENGEKVILKEYCRVIRGRKPLTETEKLKFLQNLSNNSARRKLVLHYLPWVVRRALEENKPELLLRRIESGNRALLGCFRLGVTPYDDVDYFVESAIERSFSMTETMVPVSSSSRNIFLSFSKKE